MPPKSGCYTVCDGHGTPLLFAVIRCSANVQSAQVQRGRNHTTAATERRNHTDPAACVRFVVCPYVPGNDGQMGMPCSRLCFVPNPRPPFGDAEAVSLSDKLVELVRARPVVHGSANLDAPAPNDARPAQTLSARRWPVPFKMQRLPCGEICAGGYL